MFSRKKIFFTVAATALFVRLVFFISAAGSPYWQFYRIPGLDMASLLRFSEWGFTGDAPYFSFHRLLIYIVWRLNGMVHAPSVIIALQSLGGVLLAVLLADTAWRLFQRQWCAVAAGILAALYAPFILYEGAILQESLANLLTVAAFRSLTVLWEKEDLRYGQIFFSGILLGAAAVGRPLASGFALGAFIAFFCLAIRRGGAWLKAAAMAGGIVTIWGGVSLFNFCANGSFTPFFKVMEYTRNYNIEVSGDPAAAAAHPLWNIFTSAVMRLPRLFVPWEIPENLNFHFLARRMPVLEWLPGPALLIPLAVAGTLALAVFLLYRKKWSCEILLFLPLLTLMLPLCAREPIGRYRLLLCPFLILAAAFPARWIKEQPGGYLRYCIIGTAALLLWLISTAVPVPSAAERRSGDHFAWALAIEAANGGAVPGSMAEIRAAYMTDGNIKYLINLVLRHLQKGEMKEAEQILSAAALSPETPAADRSICCYYLGVICFERRDMAGVSDMMAKAVPESLPDDLQLKYWYMRGEAARQQRDMVSALQFFKRGLDAPGGPPALREHLRKVLAALLK